MSSSQLFQPPSRETTSFFTFYTLFPISYPLTCIYLHSHTLAHTHTHTHRAEKDRASHDGRPVWMRSLLTTASEWLSMVPQVHTHQHFALTLVKSNYVLIDFRPLNSSLVFGSYDFRSFSLLVKKN